MTPIAIFASGTGTNFEALCRACLEGEISARVALLVCDKPGAEVVERAQRLGVPTLVLSPKSFPTKEEYEAVIVEQLQAQRVELVCLAGYMRIVGPTLLDAYKGRIINVHPSLLPAFKGARAIEQALEYGVKIFGVTIHYVDSELDSGTIIDQESFRYEGCDAHELAQKVHRVEHPLYIRSIKKLLKQK